jgi:hypothetical protein
MFYRVLVFVFVLAFASCVDNSDYDLGGLTLTPTMAFPLASGEIGLVNLLTDKDSSYLKTYPDGLLYLQYSKTLGSTDIRNLIDIPNNNSTTGFDLPPGTLPVSSSDALFMTLNKVIDLNLSPEQLSEMLLKAGTLDYNLSVSQPTSPNALPYEVVATLTDVVDKSTQQPLSFTASGGSGGSKPLQNYIIKMDKNKFNIKLELILKKRTSAVFVASNTKVNVQLTFKSMNFFYVKGFFGDQVAVLPPQTLDMSVFSSSLKQSSVSFVQAAVNLSFKNENGVPCEVTFTKLEAKKAGSTLPLQITPSSPLVIGNPSVIGTTSTTSIIVNNASEVVAFSPTQLFYSGSARVNKGLAGGDNFLADTSKLKVILAAEIPMYGKASGISMIDTLKMDFGTLSESSVTQATLNIGATNELPLDAYVQLYLADKDYKIVDSVFNANQTYVVKGGSVSNSGDLQSANSTNLKLDLSLDKISKLFSCKYLIIRSKMNTSKDSNGVLLNVKFKTSYRLKMNVGLLAKMKITSK